MSDSDNPFGEVIFSYTRKQAIEDGVLVDLSQGPAGALCRAAGFRYPLAMTATAFGEVIGHEGEPLPAGQTAVGRLANLLNAIKSAVRSLPRGEDRVFFDVTVDDGREPGGMRLLRKVSLWSLCGPGDQGEPVLTVMLIGED